MEGYATLRQRATRFLNDNPDVQMVTLRRPKPKSKRTYTSANDECFGRMPESCPIVRSILEAMLPEGLRVLRPDGTEVDLSDLRNDIFQRMHDEVTTKFRSALEEVCAQKHTLLSRTRSYHRQMRDWIEETETEIPEPVEPPRVRSRRDRTEVEVEVEEEYED
jgi:hypothetical protein